MPIKKPKSTYSAFLSYNRTADERVASAVQHALQMFAKPWYRRRALRVFRDDANLAASPDLQFSIKAALNSSEYFILLASPEAAASEWVSWEVAEWLSGHTSDNLLIAATRGEIKWGNNDFDRSVTTCLPRELFGQYRVEPKLDRSAEGLPR